MRRGGHVLLIAAVAACGGSRSQPPGELVKLSRLKLTRVVLAPGELAKAAAPVGRGLILATDDKNGSTFVPLVGRDSTVTVGTIAITTRPVTGSLALPPTQDPAWREAAWAGAIAATGALCKDIGDVAIAIELGDPATPASGAAVAAGILASLTGATLPDGASLAGPIHPDGTVGTTEVVNLAAAYAALTGESFPGPVALKPEQMKPDKAVETRLEAAYLPWRRRVALSWARVIDLQTEGKVPAPVAALARRADAEATGAEKLRRRGNLTGATLRIARAVALSEAAVRALEVVDTAASGKRPEALALFDRAVAPPAALSAVFDATSGPEPATVGVALSRLGAIDAALLGHARVEAGRVGIDAARAILIDRAASDRNAIADKVAPAIEQAAMAAAMAELDAFSTGPPGESPPAVLVAGAIDEMTVPYRAVATAAAERLDPAAGARARILLGFEQATGVAAGLRARWSSRATTRALARLSAASLAYIDASARSALAAGSATALVAAAERRAREHARAARIALGFVPLHARTRFQQALVVRTADPALALELLWSSSIHSQLAVALSRLPPVTTLTSPSSTSMMP